MKKILNLFGFFIFTLGFAQYDNINTGEVLNYRIHYGFLNAGTATLSTSRAIFRGQPSFYVKGIGKSAGAVRAVFKVDDFYESYINMKGQPLFYVRNVSEGSYKQHFETTFNPDNQTLSLADKKNPRNPVRVLKTVRGIQDMLSSFYYLRSLEPSQLRVGSLIKMNIWIDDDMFPFQLKVVGTENVDTKFGRINCLKIIPMVMSGRVFKASEGVTMWVTNDANHVPVSMKAELAVGSLKADLDSYKGVKYPLKF